MSIYLKTLFVITLFLFIFSITNSSSLAQVTFGTLKNSENFRINITTAQSFHNAKKISEKLNEIFNKTVYIQKVESGWRIQIGGINTFNEAKEIENKLKSIGIKNLVITKITGSSTEKTLTDLPVTNASLSKTDLFITEINSVIDIDGILSETAWNLDDPAFSGYFYQQEPFDRQPSTEKTEIRILSDGGNLYFGICCFIRNPNTLFAKQMRRDSNLGSEDNIELLLDTYHDGRNCFYFSTNPLGAMVDAVVTDEGSFINRDWDTVWYCKASINDRGWTAEIKIPFTSLQFKEGEIYDWGINIGRAISYNNESSFLVPIPRSLSRSGKYKATLFAHLKNIRSPKNGKNLQIMPYVSGGSILEYRPNTNETPFNSGVDINYNITPNLATHFTYKTDFAQVEADQEIVNFTRFDIRLPEKREFFLQDAGLFSFGGGSSSYLLFHSRTIGIFGGEKIPLIGGAKLSGKIGKYSLGLLNIQTEKKIIDDSYTEPETNYTAFKLKRDILKNSNIGMMLLNKQNAEGFYDRAAGIDTYLSFNNEYTLSGSIANNIKPDLKNKNWSGTFRAALNKDWVNASINYVHIDTLFSPDMGFVRRNNIRNTSGRLRFTKWLNNKYFKSIEIGSYINYITNHHNVLETKYGQASCNINLASGDVISVGRGNNKTFIPSEDKLRGIVLDPGHYFHKDQHISFRTFSNRPVSGSISYIWGGKYDGTQDSFRFRNSIKLTDNINVSLSYSYTNYILKNGRSKSNLASGRFSYSFSPQLFAKYYVQFNDTNKRIVSNLLIDYIFRPKSHFYLVYNENRNADIPLLKSIKDRALFVKLIYLWTI